MALTSTLKSLKITSLLLFVFCFNLQTNLLYSQDSELFAHTWYMEKIVNQDGEFYISDFTNHTATTEFFDLEDYIMYVYLCEYEDFNSIVEFSAGNPQEFTASYLEDIILPMECSGFDGDFIFIRGTIFSVFYEWNGNEMEGKNPFNYTITPISSGYSLIVENVNGDKVFYKNTPLSIYEQQRPDFVIYPNPFKDYINIENLKNGSSLSIQIFDVRGKLFFEDEIIGNLSTVNLGYLNPGVYFMVLEDDFGPKHTKKLLKK